MQGTAAMSCFWRDMRMHCVDPILKELSARALSGPMSQAPFEVHPSVRKSHAKAPYAYGTHVGMHMQSS